MSLPLPDFLTGADPPVGWVLPGLLFDASRAAALLALLVLFLPGSAGLDVSAVLPDAVSAGADPDFCACGDAGFSVSADFTSVALASITVGREGFLALRDGVFRFAMVAPFPGGALWVDWFAAVSSIASSILSSSGLPDTTIETLRPSPERIFSATACDRHR